MALLLLGCYSSEGDTQVERLSEILRAEGQRTLGQALSNEQGILRAQNKKGSHLKLRWWGSGRDRMLGAWADRRKEQGVWLCWGLLMSFISGFEPLSEGGDVIKAGGQDEGSGSHE